MVKSSRNSPLICFNGMVLRKKMPVRYLGMNRRASWQAINRQLRAKWDQNLIRYNALGLNGK